MAIMLRYPTATGIPNEFMKCSCPWGEIASEAAAVSTVGKKSPGGFACTTINCNFSPERR